MVRILGYLSPSSELSRDLLKRCCQSGPQLLNHAQENSTRRRADLFLRRSIPNSGV
jgi:hypothetical protein